MNSSTANQSCLNSSTANQNIGETEAKSISLTHIYMTAHYLNLVHAHESGDLILVV